jgi:hypothetical protein
VCQGSGPFGCLTNLPHIASLRITFREPVRHHVGVAYDYGQQVVKVVRDSARQTAHGLHFFRLTQAGLTLPEVLLGSEAL